MKEEKSIEWQQLEEIVRRHLKEEANIENVNFSILNTGEKEETLTIVREGNSKEYVVFFPIKYENMDLKGKDLEKMAEDFRFRWGYRLRDLE